MQPKYLKQTLSGDLFVYTEELALRPDMELVIEEEIAEAPAVETAPEVIPVAEEVEPVVETPVAAEVAPEVIPESEAPIVESEAPIVESENPVAEESAVETASEV